MKKSGQILENKKGFRYKGTLSAAGWGAAGLLVSLSIIQTGRISIFGYPLLLLSLLMFPLAIKKFMQERARVAD